ncbi:MAG: ferritin [Clostridia bacterium]|nr:ferritin [Clostridia bacterium]
MMDKKVYQLLNDQINKELYSAYLYLDMANYLGELGLDGFAHWYELQAGEEQEHALKIRKYLIENDAKVELLAIAKPDKAFDGILSVLEAGYEHEQYVTSLINDIYDAAMSVKDWRTAQFLDWFVKEQLEEEESARDLITKFNLFGKDSAGLYELNKELGKR